MRWKLFNVEIGSMCISEISEKNCRLLSRLESRWQQINVGQAHTSTKCLLLLPDATTNTGKADSKIKEYLISLNILLKK